MFAIALGLMIAAPPHGELAPLAFLTGHCWRGTLPAGDADTHCFTETPRGILDRHEVRRDGAVVYAGETLYSWDAARSVIRFVYSSGGKVVGQGDVRAIKGGLDFGTSEFSGKDGKKIAIATRWMRAGAKAYDAIDSAPAAPAFDHTIRYTRTD